MSVRESESQIRYISNLSQIPIDEIKEIRLSTKEAHVIINKLLDKNTAKETIHQLENMIEKEQYDKEKRMQVEPSENDPNFSIVENNSEENN